jgi:cell division protein FtsZ
MSIQFDIPEEKSSIIKVIGVGGGGNNAVNFMFEQGITGVNFVVCNTDQQALDLSPVPNKIQLGPHLTSGRGAGSLPEVGKNATLESADEIKDILLSNTKMVFITAGMGGGTGTGGAPVVAQLAKELGILTVAIVTIPFDFEGKRKREKAQLGLEELRQNVDAMIVVSNNKLRNVYGNLTLAEAFSNADNILSTAAKGIAEIITKPGFINVDFEDVKTVMEESGVALMGTGVASGEGRALEAVKGAMTSPLLNDDNIQGARGILLNITCNQTDMRLDEITAITDYVQEAAGNDTEVIWGVCYDDSIIDTISVTLIATGFSEGKAGFQVEKPKEKIVHTLNSETQKPTTPMQTQAEIIVEDDVMKTKSEEIDNSFDLTEDFVLTNSKESISFVEEEEISLKISNQPETSTTSDRASFPERKPNQIQLNFENTPAQASQANASDNEKIHQERMRRLKNMVSINRSRNHDNIKEMEEEPSYMRKKIELEDKTYSNEDKVSRYSIDGSYNPDYDDTFELKQNSFLHGTAD